MKTFKKLLTTGLVLAGFGLIAPNALEAQEFECLECRADIDFGEACDNPGTWFGGCEELTGGGALDICNLYSCQETAAETSTELLNAIDRNDFRALVRIASSTLDGVHWDAAGLAGQRCPVRSRSAQSTNQGGAQDVLVFSVQLADRLRLGVRFAAVLAPDRPESIPSDAVRGHLRRMSNRF